jgi:hypothetical protein
MKVLADGSLVIAQPLLTSLRGVEDLVPAEAENKRCGFQKSAVGASEQQKHDLLAAWYSTSASGRTAWSSSRTARPSRSAPANRTGSARSNRRSRNSA